MDSILFLFSALVSAIGGGGPVHAHPAIGGGGPVHAAVDRRGPNEDIAYAINVPQSSQVCDRNVSVRLG